MGNCSRESTKLVFNPTCNTMLKVKREEEGEEKEGGSLREPMVTDGLGN